MSDIKHNEEFPGEEISPDQWFSVLTVGDVITTVPFMEDMAGDADFQDLLEIMKTADLVVGNYEGSVIDRSKFTGSPSALSGFGWLVTNPDTVPDLKKMGFNLLSRANNHATDWGHEGLKMTDDILEQHGFMHAGTGDTRTDARSPCYGKISRGNKEVALVSWTTEITADSPAVDALFEVRARPGVSALHRHTVIRAGVDAYAKIQQILGALGVNYPWGEIEIGGVKLIVILNSVIEVDPSIKPSDKIIVESRVDEIDRKEILSGIRQAVDKKIFTIAAQHHHGIYNNSLHVDKDVREFCIEAVESGAKMIFGHGPHRLRGIEIHNKSPIFYSLGNFFFTDNTQEYLTRDEWERYVWRVVNPRLPEHRRIVLDPEKTSVADFLEWERQLVFGSEVYFQSVIAVTRYWAHSDIAMDIMLYPIELFYDGPDSVRGIPRLADRETGRKILEELKSASAEFGTEVVIMERGSRMAGFIKISETGGIPPEKSARHN